LPRLWTFFCSMTFIISPTFEKLVTPSNLGGAFAHGAREYMTLP
jgi:hypothetical protein